MPQLKLDEPLPDDQTEDVAEGGAGEHGEVDQAQPSLEEIASASGWRPQSEWEGLDPSERPGRTWLTAADFLKGQGARASSMAKTLERVKAERVAEVATAQRLAAEMAERTIREERDAIARAAASGDVDEVNAASGRLAQATRSIPDPSVAAWVADNGWFNADPAAKAVAIAEAERQAMLGKGVQEQLTASRDVVKRRFPEYFEDDAPQRSIAPTRSAIGGAPAGGLAARRAPAGPKGFKDMPAAAQVIARAFVAQTAGKRNAVSVDDYARNYWADQEKDQ